MKHKKHHPYKLWQLLIAGLSLLIYSNAFAFDYFQVLPKAPLIPATNPLSPEKINLGKQLFFDKRLSQDLSINCNHCHNLMAGGDDGMPRSKGYKNQQSQRSAPTLWNIGFQTVLYWDGRAPNLEQLIPDHLRDPAIMGVRDLAEIEKRITAIPAYGEAIKKAFPGTKQAVTQSVSMAMASFLRTLLTPNSRFDQFIRGDKSQLTQAEQQGMDLFRTEGCLACHFGVNFAGPAPGPAMTMGDGFYELFPNHPGSQYDSSHDLLSDLGVFQVSGNKADKRLWRVPPLRNIALSAPYFHNGSAKDLDEAIQVMAVAQYRKKLETEQIRKIRLFLLTLTGEIPKITLPKLPGIAGKPFYSEKTMK